MADQTRRNPYAIQTGTDVCDRRALGLDGATLDMLLRSRFVEGQAVGRQDGQARGWDEGYRAGLEDGQASRNVADANAVKELRRICLEQVEIVREATQSRKARALLAVLADNIASF